MANDNQWGNDLSDVKNLNGVFGGDKQKERALQNQNKRFVDYFYPFVHTARIEQLYVMESSSKEDLPKNLVTAGERAEYIEIGVRYGFKEIAWVLMLFLLFVSIQIVHTLKYPYGDMDMLNNGLLLGSIVFIAYGLSYTLHIGKYNIGHLTSKVITAILTGRLMIVAGALFMISWMLWGLESYLYASNETILLIADSVVPDKDNGAYPVIAGIFSTLMIPFGGPFIVEDATVAYAISIIFPLLLSTWWKIALVGAGSVFIPLIGSSMIRASKDRTKNKALEELERY